MFTAVILSTTSCKLQCCAILAMEILYDAEKAVGKDAELLKRIRYTRLSLDRSFLVKARTLKTEWKKKGNNEKNFPIDADQALSRHKQT